MGRTGATITGTWWALHGVGAVHDPTADSAGLVQDVGTRALVQGSQQATGASFSKNVAGAFGGSSR